MPKRTRFPGAILLLFLAGVGLALAGLLAPAFCTDDATDPGPKQVTITTKGVDSPARIAPRHVSDAARIAIRTEDGDAELLVTSRVVAVQLSDRGLARVRRQLEPARENSQAQDNPLGWFEGAVLAAVGSFLDHSAECPLADVRDARYEDGRIVIETNRGQRLFEHIDVDSRDVMSSFAEKDARKFVREVRRARGIES